MKGVISADDGKRYSFVASDITNLNGRNEDWLRGYEVDFEIEGKNAKDIYITKAVVQSELIPIKILACIYAASLAFVSIPHIRWSLSVVGFVTMLMALYRIEGMSKVSMMKYFVIFYILHLINEILVRIVPLSMAASSARDNAIFAVIGITIGVIVVAVYIFAIMYMWKLYSRLSQVLNDKFFLYAFYCRIVAFVSFIPFVPEKISLIFGAAVAVFEIMAWLRFREIKQTPQDLGKLSFRGELREIFTQIKQIVLGWVKS